MTTQVQVIPRDELRATLLARRVEADKRAAEREAEVAATKAAERQQSFRSLVLKIAQVEITDDEAAALQVDLAGEVLGLLEGGYDYGYRVNDKLVLMVPCRTCSQLTQGPVIENDWQLTDAYLGQLVYAAPECGACWQAREDAYESPQPTSAQVAESSADALGRALLAFLADQGIWPQR